MACGVLKELNSPERDAPDSLGGSSDESFVFDAAPRMPNPDGVLEGRVGSGPDSGPRFPNALAAGAGAGVLMFSVATLEALNKVGAGVSFFGTEGLKLNMPFADAYGDGPAVVPKNVGEYVLLLDVGRVVLKRLGAFVGADTLLLDVGRVVLKRLGTCAGAVVANPVDPSALVLILPSALFCAGCEGASLLGVFDPWLNMLFCAGGADWVNPLNILLVAGGAVWVGAPNPENRLLVAGVELLVAEGALLLNEKGVEAGAGALVSFGAALVVLNMLL